MCCSGNFRHMRILNDTCSIYNDSVCQKSALGVLDQTGRKGRAWVPQTRHPHACVVGITDGGRGMASPLQATETERGTNGCASVWNCYLNNADLSPLRSRIGAEQLKFEQM